MTNKLSTQELNIHIQNFVASGTIDQNFHLRDIQSVFKHE